MSSVIVLPSFPRCWINAAVRGDVVSNPCKGIQPFALQHHFEKPLRMVEFCGSVAERSKVLDLGSSLFRGVGPNPITAST